MKQWWRGLLLRERILVSTAVLVVSLLLLHGLLWEPWRTSGQNLKEQIEQTEEDLAWMRQAVTRLPPDVARAPVNAGQGNLVTRMNRLIGQAQLRGEMKQMKPAGDHEVRLRFEKAAFDRLLNLLREVERQGLLIRELRILPADAPGRVNATLTLRDGS
jgi:type II secretory pathway component PulM